MASKDAPASSGENKGGATILGGLFSGKTQGVKNIEMAYTRAGASNNQTPGSASKLGSQDQECGSAHQGVGSSNFSDNISDQRTEVSNA